jgi:non-homologous end joining protein Ku
MFKIYNMSDEEKKTLSKKVIDYSHSEFNLQNTVDQWHDAMLKTIKEFKNKKMWDITKL